MYICLFTSDFYTIKKYIYIHIYIYIYMYIVFDFCVINFFFFFFFGKSFFLMYAVGPSAASAAEVHVSGRSKNIKDIDLAAVVFTRQDKEMLALITSFDLSHNHIDHLHQLDALVSLTRLDVSHNKISRIGSLPLTITYLDLSHNSLSSLENISRLPHLKELNVGYNFLQNLKGLCRSQPLQVLRAEGNRIVSTLGLEGIGHMRVLCLDHNLIDNANELLFLSSTPSLEMLSLRENPVTNMNGYRILVAQLQPAVLSLDGVPLLHDEAPQLLTLKDTQKIGTAQCAPPSGFSMAFEHESNLHPHVLASATPLANIPANGTRTDAPFAQQTAGRAAFLKKNKSMGVGPVVTPVAECAGRGCKTLLERSHNCSSHSDGDSNNKLPAKEQKQLVKWQQSQLQPESRRKEKEEKRLTTATSATSSAAAGEGASKTPKFFLGEGVAVATVTAPITTERELHNAHVRIEELEKENRYLRGRNKTVVGQLRDTRRVISSQLDEINRLRLRLDEAEGREKALKERLDRVKRGVSVADRCTHNAVDFMAVEQEKMRAIYEAQIADLRQQLRHSQRQLASSLNVTIAKQPHQQEQQQQQKKKKKKESTSFSANFLDKKEKNLDDVSVEIEDVVVDDDFRALVSDDGANSCGGTLAVGLKDDTSHDTRGGRNGDTGKLALELKKWLYSEIAEDAKKAEECWLLGQLRKSLEDDGGGVDK